MDVEEWKRFLQSGQRSDRYVGRLSAYLDGYIKASSREIRIGHDYALKAIEKHGLEAQHLPLMAEAVRDGEAYFDRERHITFLYFASSAGRWFQLTVKCCTERRRLFVVTFHGLGMDDVKRKRRRYQRVWPVEQ